MTDHGLSSRDYLGVCPFSLHLGEETFEGFSCIVFLFEWLLFVCGACAHEFGRIVHRIGETALHEGKEPFIIFGVCFSCCRFQSFAIGSEEKVGVVAQILALRLFYHLNFVFCKY